MLYDKELQLDPVDAEEDTWNADYSNFVEYWSSAILVVHNLGNTVDVSKLKAKYPNTPIIEDACESLGGTYAGAKTGTLSLCSALSFFGNKNITSGEGGAFITNDDELYEMAKLWWGQGQSPEKFIHSDMGYNYRMTNVEAALLCGQLEDIDVIMNMKKELFDQYKLGLSNIDVEWQHISVGTTPSCWMFGIRIRNSEYKDARKFFDEKGIETRPMFYPITHHKHLSKIKCSTTVAEELSKECIILPSYPELTHNEIRYIIKAVDEYVKTV
jgi:perosamine synthetase